MKFSSKFVYSQTGGSQGSKLPKWLKLKNIFWILCIDLNAIENEGSHQFLKIDLLFHLIPPTSTDTKSILVFERKKISNQTKLIWTHFLKKLRFTSCKSEQPLQGMELQENLFRKNLQIKGVS